MHLIRSVHRTIVHKQLYVLLRCRPLQSCKFKQLNVLNLSLGVDSWETDGIMSVLQSQRVLYRKHTNIVACVLYAVM
jgi:hypothetical protein